jgi:hypothetical protein
MTDLTINIDIAEDESSIEIENTNKDNLEEKENVIEVIGQKIQKAIQKKIKNNTPHSDLDKSFISTTTIQQRISDSDTLSTRSKQFLTDYIERLEELKWVHYRASEYYERANLYLTLPSIILTSISGIISLLSSTDQTSSEFKYVAAISVGISASTSSLFQAVSSTLQFNTKSDLHRDVADRYSKIITKIKFEFVDHSNEDFILDLESQILDVQNMCKYSPPMFLYEAYKEFKLNNIS